MNGVGAVGWLRRVASVRRSQAPQGKARSAIIMLLRIGCVALVAWIGYIHLHLWLQGYRQIPTNGPLFLLDAIAAFVLATAMLARPRPLTGLLAAVFTASTIGALVISLSVGLFGFRESIGASYVVQSLVIETLAVLALAGWTALTAAGLSTRDGSHEAAMVASGDHPAGSAGRGSSRGLRPWCG